MTTITLLRAFGRLFCIERSGGLVTVTLIQEAA